MSPTDSEAHIDGRKARALRTRDALVTALLDMIAGGDISPTAQQLADRAGVSVRSVYQHFTDVDGLYADGAARTIEWVLAMQLEIDPSMDFPTRLDLFVTSRGQTLERLVPFNRAARLLEPHTPLVAEKRQEFLVWTGRQAARAFGPELDQMEPSHAAAVASALEVLTGVEGWAQLREHGHSMRTATEVLRVGIAALLSGT